MLIMLTMLMWNQAWAGLPNIDVGSKRKYIPITIVGDMDSKLLNYFNNPESIPGISIINSKQETILILDNGGGKVYESLTMRTAVFNFANYVYRKTNRPLIVMIDEFCGSMCTTLVAGINNLGPKSSFKLVIRPTSIFAFHAAHNNGVVNTGVTNKMLIMLESYGVSSAWINQNIHIFEQFELTRFTAQTLLNENAYFFRQSNLDQFEREYNDFNYKSADAIDWDPERAQKIKKLNEELKKADEEVRKSEERIKYIQRLRYFFMTPEQLDQVLREAEQEYERLEQEGERLKQEGKVLERELEESQIEWLRRQLKNGKK